MATVTYKQLDSELRRFRNQARRVARLVARHVDQDLYGQITLAPGEPLDEAETLEFLQRAREEHDCDELVITVTAAAAADNAQP